MKSLAHIVGYLLIGIVVLAVLIAFPWLWLVVIVIAGMALISVAS